MECAAADSVLMVADGRLCSFIALRCDLLAVGAVRVVQVAEHLLRELVPRRAPVLALGFVFLRVGFAARVAYGHMLTRSASRVTIRAKGPPTTQCGETEFPTAL